MAKKIQLKPEFVKTKNVRNFEVMMDRLDVSEGEGRLGMVFGQAGRGKTRTSQVYSARNDCIYLRVATIWRTSELDFLRALCRELEVLTPPKRKGPAFTEIIDILMDNPKPVFLDEIEKLPKTFLDLVRDLSDMSTAPFIMIGEEELVAHMRQNRRVWSRTFEQLEFSPITEGDIIVYAQAAASMNLTPALATLLQRSTMGDFRLVKRNILALLQMAHAKGVSEINEDMVKLAIKTGLSGR